MHGQREINTIIILVEESIGFRGRGRGREGGASEGRGAQAGRGRELQTRHEASREGERARRKMEPDAWRTAGVEAVRQEAGQGFEGARREQGERRGARGRGRGRGGGAGNGGSLEAPTYGASVTLVPWQAEDARPRTFRRPSHRSNHTHSLTP